MQQRGQTERVEIIEMSSNFLLNERNEVHGTPSVYPLITR